MSEHSQCFGIVERYYLLGLWDISRVQNAVIKAWITEEEFADITGEPYNSN